MRVGISGQAACVSAPDRARSIALPSQSFVSLYCLSCSSRVVLCLNLLESVLEMSFCVGIAVIADGFSGCAFAALMIWLLGSIILQMISCKSL